LEERKLILSTLPPSPSDLNEFVMNQYWPAQKAHLTQEGMAREQSILNLHLGPYFAGNMGDIDRPRILAYTNKRLETVSRETVRKELTILKHILRVATKLQVIDRNPFNDLEQKDWPAKGEERTRHLTPAEWNRLLFFLPEVKRAAAILLVNTGLRRGELFSLKWTDLNFRSQVGYLKKTKSGKPRWFVMTAEVIEALKAVPRVKNEARIFSLFSPDALTIAIKRAAKVAGIEDFRLHDLRHTFATSIRQRGAGLDVVQDLLGHADPRQTRRYAHLGDTQLEDAARSIEKVFAVEPENPEIKGKVH
jgi:integrase